MTTSTPIALITGGSRGLGRNAALKLAARGTDVVLTYRSNRAEAEAVVGAIEKLFLSYDLGYALPDRFLKDDPVPEAAPAGKPADAENASVITWASNNLLNGSIYVVPASLSTEWTIPSMPR